MPSSVSRPATLAQLRTDVAAGRLPRRSVKDEIRSNLIARLALAGAAVPGHHRLRRHRRAADRQRDPVAAQLHPARPARPGEEPHPARARRICSTRRFRSCPAARSTTIRWRRSARRAARGSARPETTCPIGWLGPRRALRREAGDAGRHDRRHDRRSRSDQGRARRPAALRRADDALRAAAAREPRHLRHQRAAGPRRQDSGRPLQHPSGRRRPDQGLPGAAAARRHDGLQRQPRGLHGARQDHHAAQGPHRLGDPHALPGDPPARDGDHRAGSLGRSRRLRAAACRRSSARSSRRSPSRRARIRRSTSGRASASGCPSRCSRTSVSNAERRALLAGEPIIVPRVTDIYAALPAITGKFELEYEGELRGADNVARDIIRAAVGNVFGGYFAGVDLRQVTEWFDLGGTLQIDDTLSAAELLTRGRSGPGPAASSPSHAGVESRCAGAAGGIGRRLHPRRALRAEEDQPLRRVPVPGRRAARRAAPRGGHARADDRAGHSGAGEQEEVLQLNHGQRGQPDRASQPHYRMKYRYSKFTGEDLDDLDLEELLSQLSDLLLSSGFDSPYGLPTTTTTGRGTRCSRCTTPSSKRCSTAGCSPTKCSRSCSARTGSRPTMRRSGSSS